MIKIKIEEVEELVQKLRNINELYIRDIIWTKNDKIVEYPEEMINEFVFTGLSNSDFICSDFITNYK